MVSALIDAIGAQCLDQFRAHLLEKTSREHTQSHVVPLGHCNVLVVARWTEKLANLLDDKFTIRANFFREVSLAVRFEGTGCLFLDGLVRVSQVLFECFKELSELSLVELDLGLAQ